MTSDARRNVRVGGVIAGRYRVEALLREGSTSIVARARRVGTDGALVALKVLHPSLAHEPELIERFRREGRALARLESDHVVRVHEVIDDPLPVLVMELLEGDDLDRVLEEEGPLPVADAVSAVWQACDAIAEAHAHGIVHRDLKPANLMRASDPLGDARVKVIDFGVAKSTAGSEPSLTGTDSAMGSPLYMAPEQLRCEPIRFPEAARVDVWALGVTLYELLVGVTPFEDEVPAMVLAGIFGREAPPIRPDRPDVPEALEAVILRCLEKDRARRWASAAALREALEAFL